MSVIIDSDNNNVNITEEPINVTVSLGGPDVAAVWGGITGDLTDQADLQAVLDDKVPYTGATGDVNLGEYGIQLGNLEFDNTPTNVPTAAGSVYWSDTDGTLNMVLKGGQTISRIGETQHIRALNNTGAQIARGKVVYVVGAQGQRLTIALADADTEILSKDTIGFTSEAIADGAEGFVIVHGVINNISTTGMTDGATVYLSQTAGSYTTTPPVDPAHLVVLGFIVNGNSGGAGSIYVKVDNGYELGELHDVDTTGATNGQVLTYNGTTWVADDPAAGGITSIATSAPITGGTITTSGTIGITQAGAAADGYLSAIDWNTFNNKQAALSLTTTGTSGAATLVGATLNIPQYQGVLTNPVTGTGTSGQVSYWSGTGTQTGSNNLFWDEVNNRLGIGLNTGLTARAHIRGSGTTSATTALLVQNSGATEILSVRDDGLVNINGYTTGIKLGANTSTFGGIYSNGIAGEETLTIRSNANTNISNITDIDLTNSQGNSTITSGTRNLVAISRGFSPTSGTGIYNAFRITPTINQTGGANGITRGLYVNPTLTAAADWRSVEFSNNTGWGLYGAGTANNYLGGRLGLNSTALTNVTLRNSLAISGSASSFGYFSDGIIQSGVTSTASYFHISPQTQNASFTLANLNGYYVENPTIGASSAVTNVYGFYGNIASGTGRWNLYMNGTAANYLAGNTSIGTTTSSGRVTVRGSGTTSATNGLLVEDSAGTDTFTIRDDGGYAFKGGTVGLAQTGYTTFTNLTTDRTCDANATTVEELADILGTLIEDLKTKGIIAA